MESNIIFLDKDNEEVVPILLEEGLKDPVTIRELTKKLGKSSV